MKRILENIKHLPSTIAGGLAVVAGATLAITNLPLVQQLAGTNAKAAQYVAGAAGIATGITLIFGVGKKKD